MPPAARRRRGLRRVPETAAAGIDRSSKGSRIYGYVRPIRRRRPRAYGYLAAALIAVASSDLFIGGHGVCFVAARNRPVSRGRWHRSTRPARSRDCAAIPAAIGRRLQPRRPFPQRTPRSGWRPVADPLPHGLKRSLGDRYLLCAGWSAAISTPSALPSQWNAGKRLGDRVTHANGSFHGGMTDRDADSKAGFCGEAVTGRSVVGLGWSYFASALKLKARHATTREFRGSKLTVSTRPKMQVSIDGELGPETPLEVSALPNAVIVAAPLE